MNDLAYKSFLPDEFNFSAGVRTTALLDEVNGKLYQTTPAFKSASEVDTFVSNIKPDKEKSTEKIDGAVATIMALDRALRHSDEGGSVYDHRGVLVL